MQYRFADCELDVPTRTLLRGGEAVSLRPKLFDLLVHLVTHHDRVVDRDELIETLWPGRYISESTLSSCVKELRKALGDTGQSQGALRTVRGVGFRFVADVRDAGAADATEPGTATSSNLRPVSVLACLLPRASRPAQHKAHALYLRAAADVVQRYDGAVLVEPDTGEAGGQMFTAVFGLPAAHEQHARCAATAAMELLSLTARAPNVRLAVTTTEAAPSDAEAAGFFADTIALAQRADLSTVAIDDATRALLHEALTTRPLGDADASAGEAYTLTSLARPEADMARVFRTPFAPHVGRREELALLRGRLSQAREGHGSAVCMCGAAGIGKSRLLSEFCLDLSSEDVVLAAVRCRAQRRDEPWFGLRELLSACLGVDDSLTDTHVAARVASQLSRSGVEADDALPLLLELLDRAPAGRPSLGMGAAARRERTHGYLRDLLLTLEATLVVVIEDLHLLDASSFECIEAILPRIARRPVLVLTTSREGPGPGWLKLPFVTQLALNHLGEADCKRLLASAPLAAGLESDFGSLARRCGGNPYFLEELVRRAVDGDESAPASVRAVVATRVDRLAPAARSLLEAAAVVGTQGSMDLLMAASALSGSALQAPLASLESEEMLLTQHVNAGTRFEFPHHLVHEIVYHRLPAETRRTLHARVAQGLQAHQPALVSKSPERLAWHLSRSGADDEAVGLWRRAARNAAARSAFVECASHARAGLACIVNLPETDARAELALRLQLATAVVATHGFASEEALRQFRLARDLSDRTGDTSGLFQSLVGMVRFHITRSDFDAASECAATLLETSRRLRRGDHVLRARGLMGETMLRQGRSAAARRHLADCEQRIARHIGGGNLSVSVAAPTVAITLAQLYRLEGDAVSSCRMLERAVELARADSHPYVVVATLVAAAELHYLADRVEAARDAAREAQALAGEQRFQYWARYATVILCWAEARLGETEDASEQIRSAVDVFRDTGTSLRLPTSLGALADTLALSGDRPTAVGAAREALDHATRTRHLYFVPHLQALNDRLGA